VKKPEPEPVTAPETASASAAPLSSGAQSLISTLGHESGPAKATLVIAAALVAWGVVAYVYQLRYGLAVTAMTDYFSWGVYIINFVFFIGISMAGSLISAILRLTNANWRHPITRMAEGITVFALIAAGLMIVVDMGRPDRFFHIMLYGRMQSPILWDVFSLSSYLAGSILFLYLPLIPDLAILRDQGARFSVWRQKLYRWFALGWTGTPEQHRRLHRAVTVMSIVIIPVAISIHTVTAWLFGMTLRPGWHSTIIGPDFVMGALYSGVAAVITIMALARWKFRLENYVTPDHFRKLGWLLLVLCVAYAYFTVNEYIGAIYTQAKTERDLLQAVFKGPYVIQFGTMVILGLVVPGIMLVLPQTRNVRGIVVASVLANIGMWIKRYIIVVPTLASPILRQETWIGQRNPEGPVPGYFPTWVEWAITIGAFAGCYLAYCLFAKVVPLVSIWETEGHHNESGESSSEKIPATRSIPAITLTVLLAGLFLGLSAGAPSARADETNSAAKPEIALSMSKEEGKPTLVATVKLNGKPLENVKIAISVERTFGQMLIGLDSTLDDGTAAVAFPSDLPGGPSGELNVRAEIKAPDQYAGIRTQARFGGALKFQPENQPFPRALWSPRAPVVLLGILIVLLGTVWGAYAYVVGQLIYIKKGNKT
jgi:molybdopterin-containing oxidoreductase family membrane subunit